MANSDMSDSKEGKINAEVYFNKYWPWTLNDMTSDLEELTQSRHIPDIMQRQDDAFFELTQRSEMTHESGSTQWQAEYPTIWMKCR